MSESRVVFERVESLALKGNPLGDPHERRLPVYLPPGYDEGQTRYPVVFLLAGYTGTGAMMLNEAAWEETIQQRMDRLIAARAVRPMILALPDCFTRYGGSQYIDSPATGNYGAHLLELVAHVDARFHTRAERDFRAVAGKSSGGYGALVSAMRHPGVFGLAADHCGDKYFELAYKPDFPKFLRAAARLGGLDGVKQVLADPAKMQPRGGDFFDLMNICAMASCYSPNARAPLGFDLPVDLYSGELDAEVWARWLAHDPVYLADDAKNLDALRGLRLLFLDCGKRDEFNLQYGTRILHRKLEAAGVNHHHEEFDGGHRGINYRYDVSLAAISAAMPH
ncbi:MAG: esterase [Planctomycetes bacterium]|nr:esterase [Planctomycetota bacterium]